MFVQTFVVIPNLLDRRENRAIGKPVVKVARQAARAATDFSHQPITFFSES